MWPRAARNVQAVAAPDVYESNTQSFAWLHIPWDALVVSSAMSRKMAYVEQI